MLFNISKK